MKLLDAINICLRANGDESINESTPLSQPASKAQGVVERKRKELLENGYPFNTALLTLTPETDGKVRVARSYLVHKWPKGITYRVDPTDSSKWILWDIDDNDYVDVEVEDFEVHFDITDFQNLPDTFARWVAHEAAIAYYGEVNPTAPIPQRLISDALRAHSRFSATMPGFSLDDASGWTALKGQ
jgi:hypothetical protein